MTPRVLLAAPVCSLAALLGPAGLFTAPMAGAAGPSTPVVTPEAAPDCNTETTTDCDYHWISVYPVQRVVERGRRAVVRMTGLPTATSASDDEVAALTVTVVNMEGDAIAERTRVVAPNDHTVSVRTPRLRTVGRHALIVQLRLPPGTTPFAAAGGSTEVRVRPRD